MILLGVWFILTFIAIGLGIIHVLESILNELKKQNKEE